MDLGHKTWPKSPALDAALGSIGFAVACTAVAAVIMRAVVKGALMAEVELPSGLPEDITELRRLLMELGGFDDCTVWSRDGNQVLITCPGDDGEPMAITAIFVFEPERVRIERIEGWPVT